MPSRAISIIAIITLSALVIMALTWFLQLPDWIATFLITGGLILLGYAAAYLFYTLVLRPTNYTLVLHSEKGLGNKSAFLNKILPTNPEGKQLCLYQNIFPTMLLILAAATVWGMFTLDDSLKHLASGSTILIAFGLLISVYVVLRNRAMTFALLAARLRPNDAQTLFSEIIYSIDGVLIFAMLLLGVYIFNFLYVLKLLNSGAENGAIAMLGMSSIAAFFGSIWITKRTYEKFDSHFGAANEIRNWDDGNKP